MASLDHDAARPDHIASALTLRYLARQWARRPWLFAGLASFTLGATVCDMSIPIAAGWLIDAAAAGNATRAAPWPAFLIFIALAVGATFFRQGVARCEIAFSSRNMEELAADAFAIVQRFSADWHANTFAGATVRKLTRGMWAYDMVTATLVFGLAPTLLVLFGMTAYLLARFPEVGLFALAVLSLFVALSVWLSVRYLKPANVEAAARDSAIGAALADAVSANPAVKSFGAEEREDARFRVVMEAWRRAAGRSWGRHATIGLFQNIIVVVMQSGLVGLLLLAWSQGRATPGDVAFAIAAFLTLSGYIRRFGEEVRNVQRGLDELADLANFHQLPPGVPDQPDARPFAPGRGRIVFEDVTFGYANQAGPLYRAFSLVIEPGERVALVGATGAGKSTFVKLLQRLYDVDEGRILIDGQNVAGVGQASLRRAIALVPQDPALFHRSIAENIAYGQPGASQAAIEAAARRARAHDFIASLPQGYATLVGERGVKLSGGERQRVAIARALLADAPILVLDEATSSLDNETEREVQAAMEALMAGRTTIVIAHRLSTVRAADRILVFEAGRIAEQGRHEELVARGGGVYARLHALAVAAA